MDPDPSDANPNMATEQDINLVETLVQELKNQGIFDKIRKDCLTEVDTKVRLAFFPV